MFKTTDFITAKVYAVLMGVSYNTAKKIYCADKHILGVQGRKLTVAEYCRLWGATLDEVNRAYAIA